MLPPGLGVGFGRPGPRSRSASRGGAPCRIHRDPNTRTEASCQDTRCTPLHRDPGHHFALTPRTLQNNRMTEPHDVICQIHARCRRNARRDRAGSGSRANRGTVAVNIIQGRRRFPLDRGAMEPCQDPVGQGKGKMGRLPEAGAGSKSDRPEELVIPGVLHDKLSNGRFHRSRWKSLQLTTRSRRSSLHGRHVGCWTWRSPLFLLRRLFLFRRRYWSG